VKKVDVDEYTDAVRYTQVRALGVAGDITNVSGGPKGAFSHWAVAWGCVGSVPGGGIQENKVFYERKDRRGQTGVAGKRDAHDFVLDDAGAGVAGVATVSISDRQSGMFGRLHAMKSVATLLLMCDGRDLGIAIGERPPKPGVEGEAFARPRWKTRYTDRERVLRAEFVLVRCVSGGIGFSEPLYRAHELLLAQTRELIVGCSCESGCPSCVGLPVIGAACQGSRAGDSDRICG